MRRATPPLDSVTPRRNLCQGAAARRVSITFRRTPPRGLPGRTPAGRPRSVDELIAPTRPLVRERGADPAFNKASRPAGIAACVASSTTSGSCSMGSWGCSGVPSGGVSLSWGGGSGGGGGGSASADSGAAGSWVARGASTRRPAIAASSRAMRVRPASAADASAARSASSTARNEWTPSAADVAHSASTTPSSDATPARRARAAATSPAE